MSSTSNRALRGVRWVLFSCVVISGAALGIGCAAPENRESAVGGGRLSAEQAPAAAPAPSAGRALRPEDPASARNAPAAPASPGESGQAPRAAQAPAQGDEPSFASRGPGRAAATGNTETPQTAGRPAGDSPEPPRREAARTGATAGAAAGASARTAGAAESGSTTPSPAVDPRSAARPEDAKVPPVSPAVPASPDAPAATGTPHLELSPTDFDFGDVWQGMPAEGEFTIRNVGTAPMTVETRSSCGCTLVTKPKSPLEPGAATTFKISYNTGHAGKAQKTVTITTNDPTQTSTTVQVHGQVKALVSVKPTERIAFNDLEADSVQSQTARIEVQYDAPLNLRLRENQAQGRFAAELKEIEAGRVFELTVTTVPPLQPNGNTATIQLETGLEKTPTVPVNVSANVVPRVAVVPQRLNVPATATQPAQQELRIRYRAGTTLNITDVQCNQPAITWELLPAEEPATGANMLVRRLLVNLPAQSELPETGAVLTIRTDDPDEHYRKLDVPIVKARARPARTKAAARPPAPVRPTGGEVPAGQVPAGQVPAGKVPAGQVPAGGAVEGK